MYFLLFYYQCSDFKQYTNTIYLFKNVSIMNLKFMCKNPVVLLIRLDDSGLEDHFFYIKAWNNVSRVYKNINTLK